MENKINETYLYLIWALISGDRMPIEEVMRYIATNEIKWIDLQFFDIDGVLHKTTVSNKELEEGIFTKGIAAANLKEVFGTDDQGETILRPDPDTMARLPWEPSSVRLLSDVMTAISNEHYLKDSRYVIERVETNLEAVGVKNARVGAEFEFYIFDAATVDRATSERGTGTLLESREAFWSQNVLAATKGTKGAYSAQPYDTLYPARTQLSETLEENFGFAVDGHRHGRGQAGQQSIDLHEYSPKTAADAFSTVKFVLRNLVNAVNAATTFMPYAIEGEKGSMMNISTSLWKAADNNVFYDANDSYAQLSQTGRYFVGGLLEHAAALMLFTAPISNSYKKLAADPKVLGWSKDNSKAIVQVPQMKKNNKESKRVVFTGADPSINPYLAYAAVLAAGLDGIKSKNDPGDPVEEGKEETKKRKWAELPTTLYESIEALGNDPKFIKGVISSELLDAYIDKKLLDHRESLKSVSAWETKKYFNV